jgi:hypothetical protein
MSVTSTLAKDASLPTELELMGMHRPCQEYKTRVKVTDSDKHSNGQEDRQTRLVDRHLDRPKERRTDRQTDRLTKMDRQTYRQIDQDGQTDKQTD